MIENNLLYIIGNGFDRYHGFPTSYCDFENFMEDWSREMYYEIHEYWNFKVEDSKWCDFENDLSSYDSSKMYNYCAERNRAPEDIADECSVITQQFFDGITNCFIEWVKGIQLKPRTKLMPLNKNAQYINFNYTRTLQDIYEISEDTIWHIHGSSLDNDVIFGHKVKQEIEYNYSDDTGMPSTNEEWGEDAWRFAKLPLSQFRKKTEQVIRKNRSRFLNYRDLENIYVLGHSLADVDLPYFEMIHENNKKTKWYVSFYNNSEQERLCSQLKKVGVQESQIKMIKMNDLDTTMKITTPQSSRWLTGL
jgi:hypothetical protein